MQEKTAWFKAKDGDNRIRILTKPVKFFERFSEATKKSVIMDAYEEGVSTKYLSFIVDYTDGKIVLYKLPGSVGKEVATLMQSDEYKFEEFPMPYDITVKKTGEGKETRYSVLPARMNSDLSIDIMEELGSLNDCAKILEAMKKKQGQTTQSNINSVMAPAIEYPKNDGTEIPF